MASAPAPTAAPAAAPAPVIAKPIAPKIKGVKSLGGEPSPEAPQSAPEGNLPAEVQTPSILLRTAEGEKSYTPEQAQHILAKALGDQSAQAKAAMRLQREVQQLRQQLEQAAARVVPTPPQQTETPATTPATKRFIEAVGEPFWNQVKQVIAEHGPEVGLAMAFDKFEASSQDRFASIKADILKELKPQIEPLVEQHTQIENKKIAADMWNEFATYTDETSGQPIFPELQADPELAQMASLLWLQIGNKFGREFAMSEYGLHSALRDAIAFKQYHATQNEQAGQTADNVLSAIERQRQAGASVAVSAPSPVATASDQSPLEDQAQLKKRIRQANTGHITTKTGIKMGVRPLHQGDF